MPLLRNGQLAEQNPWVRVDDETGLPLADTTRLPVVSLQRFLDGMREHRRDVAGVSLAPDDDVTALAPWLDQLQLICIEIPVFTDGRGYSHARLLRERLGYVGEIRATGDVRPDQILHMARVGIDAFEFADEPDSELLTRILGRYRAFYQPSYPLAIAG